MSSKRTEDDYVRHQLIEAAKDFTKKTPCPRCRKELKVVPLNELPTVIPTDLSVFCKTCGYSDSLSRLNKDFGKYLQSICDKLSRVIQRSSGEDVTNAGIIIPKK